jgi:hypothetical protein
MGWASPDLSAVKNNSIYYCLLHSTYFPFDAILQCIGPICWSTHSGKIASNVSMLISSKIYRTPERSSSADPNCCAWRRLLRCLNKKQETRNKKKSERVKSGKQCGCDAIHKKLSPQNTLVTVAVCGLALSACTTNLLSLLSPRQATISVRIFRIFGDSRRP